MEGELLGEKHRNNAGDKQQAPSNKSRVNCVCVAKLLLYCHSGLCIIEWHIKTSSFI